MKIFKSKIAYGILIPVLIVLVGLMILPIVSGAPGKTIVLMIAILLPTLAFVLDVFCRTTYRISDEHLVIKCGIFYRSSLRISNITSIRKTRNLIASPAASLDRIELYYGKSESVILSPRDKLNFINELVKINPRIRHNLE